MNMKQFNIIRNDNENQSFYKKKHLIMCIFTMIIFSYNCAGSQSAIMKAASTGDINSIKKMYAEGQNINERDSSGLTPLMNAILYGQNDTAKYLIESGADISLKDKSGYDALLYAVNNNKIEMVNILLDRGANIETKDNAYMTPLNSAASYGYYDMVEILLNKGANIETKDWLGGTPVLNAVKCSVDENIIRLLIRRGANLDVKDNEGYTPLAWALYYKKTAVSNEIQKAMTDTRQGIPSAKIVFIRESNVLIPGELQDVPVYIDEQMVANLSRNSTSYVDVTPGKCTMVIKGGKLDGNHIKSFDAVAGQTYYFSVTRRISGIVGGIGGAVGQVIESQSKGEEAGPFKITPLEESVAKEKISALQKTN